MSVTLRLRRTGAKNKPSFRVVATDVRNPRDGRFIENLGYYSPRTHEEKIDLVRIDYWLSKGAKPSETVQDIIARARSGKALTPPPPKPVPAPKAAAPAEAPAAAPAEPQTEAKSE